MMALALYGGASAYSYAIFQANSSEIKYATSVMLQTAEVVRSISSEGGGGLPIQFKFKYGLLEINQSGILKLAVNDETYYTENRILIQYVVNNAIYPPYPIFDKGFELKTFYASIDEGNIVYHQTLSGKTYVTFEQRPVILESNMAVHVFFAELTPPTVPLALDSGPILLRLKDIMTKSGSYPNGVRIHIQCGSDSQEITVQNECTVYAHIFTIGVEPF